MELLLLALPDFQLTESAVRPTVLVFTRALQAISVLSEQHLQFLEADRGLGPVPELTALRQIVLLAFQLTESAELKTVNTLLLLRPELRPVQTALLAV